MFKRNSPKPTSEANPGKIAAKIGRPKKREIRSAKPGNETPSRAIAAGKRIAAMINGQKTVAETNGAMTIGAKKIEMSAGMNGVSRGGIRPESRPANKGVVRPAKTASEKTQL